MAKKFYISDWHFGHKGVLAFDNRPFKSIEEMNNELIRRWNSVVSDGNQATRTTICTGWHWPQRHSVYILTMRM